jgi:enoyl-CoA hydratase
MMYRPFVRPDVLDPFWIEQPVVRIFAAAVDGRAARSPRVGFMPDYGIDTLAPVAGLVVTLADGVLSVTINRPESLNSVTMPVLAGIADAMEWAATDPRVKVVRLGGAGRGFSSGAGIGADDVDSGGSATDIIEEINRAVRAITSLPHPVVAVVQGPAAGVGVSLALACDLVLASDKAFFMLAFTKIGLMPDGGASALVAAAVGRIRAMQMALLPERLPAAEAMSWGLVSAVYPADDFEAEVDKVLARLLAGPAVAYAKTKHAINAATLTELDPALQREFYGQSGLLRSHDFKEGATAFQQRRTPAFTDS